MVNMDIYHLMQDLVNVNEKRVWNMLSDYLDSIDTSKICLCSQCVIDMAAITLNNIQPQYQLEYNDSTNALSKVQDVDIYKEIVKAVETVSECPHH